MTTSVKLNQESKATDVLQLPKGRLMLGKVVVDFSPENVVEAARSIILGCEHEFGEYEFYTQAGVLEHAGNEGNWNRAPEYKAI